MSAIEEGLLNRLFDYIEENLYSRVTAADAAQAVGYSPVHLYRLFTAAYGFSVADYIRKRKLTDSLERLLGGGDSVLDIALSYGFEFEQSFTRAFRAEFGLTPGRYRRARPVLRATFPIKDFGVKCGDGLMFGPETVVLPKLNLVGLLHKIPFENACHLAPRAAIDFWDNYRQNVSDRAEDVFYGLTRIADRKVDWSYYLTSVAVNKPNVPNGMAADSFGGKCVRFHYVGRHHYRELSTGTAQQMYRTIGEYFAARGGMPDVHLERVDPKDYDGEICLMEWFAYLP